MQVIEKRIEYTMPDVFKIYPLGDIHCGSIHCSERQIKETVNKIKDDPYAYWIGMGDYADCILKDDKRFDIEGLASWVTKGNIVESQREWLVGLFKPIQDKCIGLLTGNHEETIHMRYQDDLIKNLCKDLNVPYAGYTSFIDLIFQRQKSNESHRFRVHAWHGAGTAQTEGSRVMRLMRLVNEFEAQIYLMGHLHAIAVYTPDRIVLRNGRVKSEKLIAACTGSWLKAYQQPHKGEYLSPSYPETKGYKPARMGCPVVHIRPQYGELSLEVN